MTPFIVGFILTCLCILILGLIIGHDPDNNVAIVFLLGTMFFGSFTILVVSDVFTPKKECEAELPRNVECVWASPVTVEENGGG